MKGKRARQIIVDDPGAVFVSAPVATLIEMLQAGEPFPVDQPQGFCFDNAPEEIGCYVMENRTVILAALIPAQIDKGANAAHDGQPTARSETPMPKLTMCATRAGACPLEKECARHAASGAMPDHPQIFARFDPAGGDCESYVPTSWEPKSEAAKTQLAAIKDRLSK